MPVLRMEVDLQVKDGFFDREAVVAAIGPGRAEALKKLGLYVRKTAIQSMRRQKKASPPGRPPAFHGFGSPSFNLRRIEFAFASNKQSMVIGPLKSNRSKSKAIPGLHEHGGSAPVKEWRYIPQGQYTEQRLKKSKKLANQFNRWMNLGDKSFPNMNDKSRLPAGLLYRVDTRVRNARYPKRPFMGPALRKSRAKAPHLFRNILRRKKSLRKVKSR